MEQTRKFFTCGWSSSSCCPPRESHDVNETRIVYNRITPPDTSLVIRKALPGPIPIPNVQGTSGDASPQNNVAILPIDAQKEESQVEPRQVEINDGSTGTKQDAGDGSSPEKLEDVNERLARQEETTGDSAGKVHASENVEEKD